MKKFIDNYLEWIKEASKEHSDLMSLDAWAYQQEKIDELNKQIFDLKKEVGRLKVGKDGIFTFVEYQTKHYKSELTKDILEHNFKIYADSFDAIF